jgi:type I site-specific restriction endonuclease
MFSSSAWFEKEQLKIEKINKAHLKNIEKLKKIAQINSWLDTIVKPKLKITPNSENLADENLVRYFDLHSKNLNLEVSKYIYSDAVAKHLLVNYEISRFELEKLEKLISLHYTEGFLQFREFDVDKKIVKGTIQFVQPFNGDKNESK